MKRFKLVFLSLSVCLLLTEGGYGQIQRANGVRNIDAGGSVSRPEEFDGLGTSSTVATGPQALVPRLMKFGGVLHDVTGKPLTGTVDVTFTLYSTETGGEALWFETQSVQADELGRYTTLLGAMHTDGLPIALFTSGEAHWLGIQVGLEAEQHPRVLLVSVPYALKAGDAETLGGKPASAYMLADAQNGVSTSLPSSTNSAQTGTSGKNQTKSRTANTTPLTPVCASMTSNTGGTANTIAMFDAACDVVNSGIIQSGSNVGIGTATPGTTLHLVGNNSTLTISGTGTHQVNIVGATGGRLGQDAVGFFFSSDTNGASIRFATNNGSGHEWMRITSAGNVGIGTAAPGASLEVNGTSKFDGLATFSAGQSATGNVSSTGQLISTVATGTAPLSVASTTQVANLNASQLGGLSSSAFALLSGGNTFTGGQSVTGTVTATSFSGSGAGLTSVPASALAGGIAVGGVGTGGITVALNSTSPDIVNGFSGNSAGGLVVGGTISGGGGTALANSVTANYASIGGGLGNVASGTGATVAGGQQNVAGPGIYAYVGGGAQNTASGTNATIVGGGVSNTASGTNSTIPGGHCNVASGSETFAAGSDANATFTGSFVWADSQGCSAPFTDTANNQFLIRASGGVGIGTASPKATLDTAGQDRRKPVAFATLTACSSTIEGETAAITDSTVNTWGSTITGGGTNHVLGYCDGTSWTVSAK